MIRPCGKDAARQALIDAARDRPHCAGSAAQTADWLLLQLCILHYESALPYSTVTLLARLRGWSTSVPLATAAW